MDLVFLLTLKTFLIAIGALVLIVVSLFLWYTAFKLAAFAMARGRMAAQTFKNRSGNHGR